MKNKKMINLLAIFPILIFAKEPKTVEYYKNNPNETKIKIKMCEDPRRVYISDEDYIIGISECKNAIEASKGKPTTKQKEVKKLPKETLEETQNLQMQVAKQRDAMHTSFEEKMAYKQDYIKENLKTIEKKAIKNLDLIYPKESRKSIVEIAISINTNGKITKTSINKSSGEKLFDQNALKAVNKLKGESFKKPKIKIDMILSFS